MIAVMAVVKHKPKSWKGMWNDHCRNLYHIAARFNQIVQWMMSSQKYAWEWGICRRCHMWRNQLWMRLTGSHWLVPSVALKGWSVWAHACHIHLVCKMVEFCRNAQNACNSLRMWCCSKKSFHIDFFNTEGIVCSEFINRGQMVNSAFYEEVLQRMREAAW
jgi:hypothetical protein